MRKDVCRIWHGVMYSLRAPWTRLTFPFPSSSFILTHVFHSSTYLLISSSFFFIFFQDASTQGLKVTAVDHNLDTVFNTAINFDTALPHYKTKGGFHQGENDVVTAVRVTVLMHPLRFFDEIEDTDGVHHAP